MGNQIAAVFWKEWMEILQQRSTRGGLINWVIMVFLLGVFIPIQFGSAILTEPALLIAWSWPAMLGVVLIVADAIAGERERHTLETLLASCLSDRSILYGKLLAGLAYGASIEVASLLLSVVTVNLTHPTGRLQFIPAGLFAMTLLFSLLGLLLISGIGVLVSLRSSSVRSAYQKVSLTLVAAVILVNILISVTGDSISQSPFLMALSTHGDQIALAIGLVLAVLDVILLSIASNRFRRSLLVLD